MNEAAILAARRSLKEISKEEISDALERIVAGPEKKGAVMTEQKKRLVAYHEVRPAALSSPNLHFSPLFSTHMAGLVLHPYLLLLLETAAADQHSLFWGIIGMGYQEWPHPCCAVPDGTCASMIMVS